MSVTEWNHPKNEEEKSRGDDSFPLIEKQKEEHTVTAEESLTGSGVFRIRREFRISPIAIYVAILILLTALVMGLIFGGILGNRGIEDTTTPSTEQGAETPPSGGEETTAEPVPPSTDRYRITGLESAVSIRENALYSDFAILCDPESMTVIAAKHADEKMYPASMTKIMTFLVAYDLLPDRTELLTLTKDIRASYPEGSRVGIDVGDRLTVEQCMVAMLLESDTDAVLMLANAAAGSEEAFVGKMNEKAEALGLKNTHFVTATGLHDRNHTTTALEMAEIFAEAMKNELFRTILTANPYVTYLQYEKNGKPAEYRMTFRNSTFTSRLDKNGISPKFTGGRVVGGKTGFTDEAAYCEAALALTDSGKYYIAVLGHAGTGYQSSKDTVSVFEQFLPR